MARRIGEKNGICWDLSLKLGIKWDLEGFGSWNWGEMGFGGIWVVQLERKWDLLGFDLNWG